MFKENNGFGGINRVDLKKDDKDTDNTEKNPMKEEYEKLVEEYKTETDPAKIENIKMKLINLFAGIFAKKSTESGK